MDAIPLLSPEELAAFLSMPALEGPTPNYKAQLENPPNNNIVAHVAIPICVTLAVLCFLIRVYARIFRLRKVELEDGLMFIGFVFYIVYIYDLYRMMDLTGFFVHQWDITYGTLNELQFILHIGGSFYTITLATLKAAILLEWTRVFVPLGSRTAFWWICNVLAVMQIAFMLATIIAMQLGCNPWNKNWDFTVAGTCYDKSKLEIATASISLFFDVVILILPQKVIWDLQMSLKQKFSVSIIFSVGVLACLSACFRLVVTIQYTQSTDVVYHVASLALWALAECTCGFLVFCVPSAPKAFTDTGVFTRVKNTMRSWTGLQPSSMKSGGNTNLTGNTAVSSRIHTVSKSMGGNDEYLPIQDDHRGDDVVLTKFGHDDGSTEELRGKKNGAIVRTTKFTTQEEYVGDDGDIGGHFDRQHPWANHHHKGSNV